LKIILNGKETDFNDTKLSMLLEQSKVDSGMVVVEKNGEIVHREKYTSELLKEGDVIEIVGFVGGG